MRAMVIARLVIQHVYCIVPCNTHLSLLFSHPGDNDVNNCAAPRNVDLPANGSCDRPLDPYPILGPPVALHTSPMLVSGVTSVGVAMNRMPPQSSFMAPCSAVQEPGTRSCNLIGDGHHTQLGIQSESRGSTMQSVDELMHSGSQILMILKPRAGGLESGPSLGLQVHAGSPSHLAMHAVNMPQGGCAQMTSHREANCVPPTVYTASNLVTTGDFVGGGGTAAPVPATVLTNAVLIGAPAAVGLSLAPIASASPVSRFQALPLHRDQSSPPTPMSHYGSIAPHGPRDPVGAMGSSIRQARPCAVIFDSLQPGRLPVEPQPEHRVVHAVPLGFGPAQHVYGAVVGSDATASLSAFFARQHGFSDGVVTPEVQTHPHSKACVASEAKPSWSEQHSQTPRVGTPSRQSFDGGVGGELHGKGAVAPITEVGSSSREYTTTPEPTVSFDDSSCRTSEEYTAHEVGRKWTPVAAETAAHSGDEAGEGKPSSGSRRCSFEGCKKNAAPGGGLKPGRVPLCAGHGGGRRCQHPGCSTMARAGGPPFCTIHGGGKRCQYGGCTKSARTGGEGFCVLHGGGRRCTVEGCMKSAASGSLQLCISHGGGKRCAQPRCTKSVASGGAPFCIAHGGGRRCWKDRCGKSAVPGGPPYCIAHGGGRRCSIDECTRLASSGQPALCSQHGGAKRRCMIEGCTRSASQSVDRQGDLKTSLCFTHERFLGRARRQDFGHMYTEAGCGSAIELSQRTGSSSQPIFGPDVTHGFGSLPPQGLSLIHI